MVDSLVERLVSDAEAIRAAGVEEGRASAAAAYFGQSAVRLTAGIFATALHEAASQMSSISPEAAQFLGEQAKLFAEFAHPPQVTSVSPATDAVNVHPDDQVVLGFSSPLNPDAVTTDTVYVAPSSGGSHLAGKLSYDEQSTVTFVPDNGFSAGVKYTITVSKDVRSKLGQSMGTDWTSMFTAAAA